jgi:hypothetical protein
MKYTQALPFAAALILSGGVAHWAQQTQAFAPEISVEESIQSEQEGEHIEGAIRSMYSMRLNEQTGTIEPEWVEQAMAQADRLSVSRRLNKKITWEGMGPDNVGGRTRAFLMHRDSANLWFVGAVSGGLFRSNTYGQSWKPVNDQQENLSVTCLAQTPDGTIYYGTGEGGFVNLSGTRNGSPAFLGGGLFKSSDASGTSFTLMNNARDSRFQQCNGMASHPTEDKFYVATEQGLFEFSNGGGTLTRLTGGAIKEVKIDKDGVVWASNGAGTVYKTDGAGGLKVANLGANMGGRTSIAISPEDPNYVYICGAGSGSNYGRFMGVWRTTDGGTTWEEIVSYSSVTDIFGSNRQGWYDNVISVHPKNKDFVMMGGVVLATWDQENGFRETGSTFGAPWNNGYVHADKHIIEWNTRTNPVTCIVGSDGGLYSSQNLSTWTSINRGFTSLQLYNVAANELGHVVGGSQDNGTYLLNFSGNSFGGKPSQTGISIYGGDGFDVEFSKYHPATVFMSTYYGTVARSSNSGQSSSTFFDDRQEGKIQTDFNTTYCLWEQDKDVSRLFLAKDAEIWVAVNPTDFSNNVSWFMVAGGLGNNRIIEMDYTPDGDHLFACKQGRIYRIDGLNSASYTIEDNPGVKDIPVGISLNNITPSTLTGRTVTSVNVDPSNPDHLIVTCGGYGNTTYVYESNDALSANPTFNNITGDLPSMPVYDAVVDVDDANRIVLATDFGVWVTENGGLNWEEANEGMARVPVFEIRAYEWRPWEGMVMYLGTHGRGYFKSTTLLTNAKGPKASAISATLYPNPSQDRSVLNFQSKASGQASIQVLNVQGQVVRTYSHSMTIGANSVSLNVAGLTSGTYFVRISGSGQNGVTKLLVP